MSSLSKAVFLILLAPTLLGAKVKTASLGELVVGPDAMVAGAINGRPAIFEMAADGASAPFLNRQAMEALAVKAGPFGGTLRVGPVKVKGWSAVIQLDTAGAIYKRRAFWFERNFATRGDGALGPAAVPHAVVTFRLRPSADGERLYRLAMSNKGDFGSLGHLVRDGDRDVLLVWDLLRHVSLVSAPTAWGLSGRHGGTLSGPLRSEKIKMGIDRPVKRLNLADPLIVGPITLRAVNVRTNDYGDANAIRSDDADPSEIVVTAPGKKQAELIRIGRSEMTHCSQLTFDKPRKEIRLSCLP